WAGGRSWPLSESRTALQGTIRRHWPRRSGRFWPARRPQSDRAGLVFISGRRARGGDDVVGQGRAEPAVGDEAVLSAFGAVVPAPVRRWAAHRRRQGGDRGGGRHRLGRAPAAPRGARAVR